MRRKILKENANQRAAGNVQTVLSIDVDYFAPPTVYLPPKSRPEPDKHKVRPLKNVEEFLRAKCHLSKRNKVKGLAARDHDAAFPAIANWIKDGELQPGFRLAHIDAHADLGLADAGYSETVEDVLHRSVEDRSQNLKYLEIGNWLAYAIANRWIGEIMFIRESNGIDSELMAQFYFCNSADCSVLQMRPMTELQYMNVNVANRKKYATLPTTEPEISFRRLKEKDFDLMRQPDFVFTCLSPEFCPETADPIFELVKQMIHP
jgi:hypothetical protein